MEKDTKETKEKKMVTNESIYKIMQWLPPAVTSVFFVKNVLAGNTSAMIVIGICLAVFAGMLVLVSKRKFSLYNKEFILSVTMPFLIFIITMYSGESYSDDFVLFLAVIALTGMFLEPQFTKIQIFITVTMLVLMYIIHPHKAESLSQYILCCVVYILCAALFYQVIKRGRTFIAISAERAKESGNLLESIRGMGAELQKDFTSSSAGMEEGISGLLQGSKSIANGATDVSFGCEMVHDKIKETEVQIDRMNREVKQVESALAENSENVKEMSAQVDSINKVVGESGVILHTMEEQMKEISDIAKQISNISFQLTILALNASVESARAGDYGAGFDVLAGEMRNLSESSTVFSERVAEVVAELINVTRKTNEKFADSEIVLSNSGETMTKLTESFTALNKQFESLYDNIEQQNEQIQQIDNIFGELNTNVGKMHDSSQTNAEAVKEIVSALDAYRESVNKIVANTQTI